MTPRTVEASLRAAAACLLDAGIERGRVEAEILLAHVLEARRLDLLLYPTRILSACEAEAFDALVARRAEHYPLPYLLGEWEFMGLRFQVNEAVLIPRPETEILVEEAIAFLQRDTATGNPLAVDVGAGSGAIAVSLAHYVPEARVAATDISPQACAVARENAQRLGVAARVTVREGDLLAPLEKGAGAAVLCANLPYIPDESRETLQAEVRDWEPKLALMGGPGGLEIIHRLILEAPAYLRPGGLLLLEIGPEARQAERLTERLRQTGEWREIRVLPDLAGLPRVVAARRAE